MSNRAPFHHNWLPFVLGILGLDGLYAISRYNFLLFHCLAEAFSIVIAIAVFAIFWNTRRFFENGFYLVIGFGCLFAGLLDLDLHFRLSGNVGVPRGQREYCPASEDRRVMVCQPVVRLRFRVSATQGPPEFGPVRLQPAFRDCSRVHLLLASLPGLLDRRGGDHSVRENRAGRQLPRYLGALVLLARNRREFDSYVFQLLAAVLTTFFVEDAASLLATDLNGFARTVAHLCQVVALYFVYKAFVEVGLTRPYDLLFRSQQQSARRWR